MAKNRSKLSESSLNTVFFFLLSSGDRRAHPRIIAHTDTARNRATLTAPNIAPVIASLLLIMSDIVFFSLHKENNYSF